MSSPPRPTPEPTPTAAGTGEEGQEMVTTGTGPEGPSQARAYRPSFRPLPTGHAPASTQTLTVQPSHAAAPADPGDVPPAVEEAARPRLGVIEPSALPPVHALLAPVIVKADELIEVERLTFDYSMSMGQIRKLTDERVARVKASLDAVPPQQPVNVTVVPADTLGL